MIRKTLSMAFTALFMGVSVTLAGLDATPILNASFESVEDGGTPGGWGYIIDDWYENERSTFRDNFYEKAAGIGLVGDDDLWAGTETGGMFYQAVGTVDDSQTYSVTALIGARWGTSFDVGIFSLYASTVDDATNAVDGVELSSFATELSSTTVTVADGISTGDPNVYTILVTLTTATGHAGEVLWLEFGSSAGKDYFDKIAIAPAAAPGPPVWDKPLTSPDAIASVSYESHSLVGKASDPNGDPIAYSKDPADTSWLTVAPDGALGGTPTVSDIGLNTFTVIATDVDGATSATLSILVRTTAAPEWAEPVTGSNARADTPYSDTLAGKAFDPDGVVPDDQITFVLVDAGTWLTVGIDGALSGTPGDSDLGTNTFMVTATDPDGSTDATLSIWVFKPTLDDSTAISVNFTEGNANQQIDPSNFAGLDSYVYTNWNNTAGVSGSESDLGDSDGNTTTASVEWNSNNMWGDGVADTDANAGIGDAMLARGYFDDGNAPGPAATWTVTGVPYAAYTAVIYLSTDNAGGNYQPFVVNGVSSSVTASPKRRYVNPNWDGSNTIVVENLTGDLVVSGLNRDGSNRGSVAGFQIIEVAYISGGPATVMIAGPVSAGTQMEISWMGENEKLYSVETNSNLIIGDWQSFMTGLIGDGGTITVTNTIGPDQTFYRVISK